MPLSAALIAFRSYRPAASGAPFGAIWQGAWWVGRGL